MANIVYNQFLMKISGEGVDLTLNNSYKICLLKEGVEDSLLTPEFSQSYSEISILGWECEDSGGHSEANLGYKEGGKYINFVKQTFSGYVDYLSSSTKITFNKVTLDEDNAACYALVYRESDGLLISLFDLRDKTTGEGITLTNDSLVLNWGDVSVIRIGSSSCGGSSVSADESLSLNSTNPVQNKVVTAALRKYGIQVEGVDDPSESESDITDGMDSISNVPKTEIEEMFSSGGGGGSTTVDEVLSLNSNNPVRNSVITAALMKYGIKLEGDDPPEGDLTGMDSSKLISDADLEDIFSSNTGETNEETSSSNEEENER